MPTQAREYETRHSWLWLALVFAGCHWHSHPQVPQGEARHNLRQFFVAEQVYFAEHDTYTSSVEALAPLFQPERGNRFTYFLGGPSLVDRSCSTEPGLHGATGFDADVFRGFAHSVPDVSNLRIDGPDAGGFSVSPFGAVQPGPGGSFVIVASANLDADDEVETWAIANLPLRTQTLTPGKPQQGPPGVPFEVVSDLH